MYNAPRVEQDISFQARMQAFLTVVKLGHRTQETNIRDPGEIRNHKDRRPIPYTVRPLGSALRMISNWKYDGSGHSLYRGPP